MTFRILLGTGGSGPDAGKLTGEASVAVEIKTIFFSETVTARTRQKFAGSNGDPTFAELMAPAGFTGELPWNLYCSAFSADFRVANRPLLPPDRVKPDSLSGKESGQAVSWAGQVLGGDIAVIAADLPQYTTGR